MNNTRREWEANKFVSALFNKLAAPEQIEVRWKAPGEGGSMRRRFFADAIEVVRECLKLAPAHDVYVGIAPRKGNVGTKEGVSRLLVIWADLDFKSGHTRESRTDQLQTLPHSPSMVVDSGGGFHTYWFLSEDAGDSEQLERAENVMARLAAGLGGDAVFDRSRILRVPGTYNHKLADSRLVKLVECHPRRRYALDQLETMAEALPNKTEPRDKKNSSSERNIAMAGIAQRDVLKETVADGRRNVVLASVAGSLRDRGLDEETIRVVLLAVNEQRCAPPLEKTEVNRVARSVSRYESGSPRYKGSPTKRVYRKKGDR